jgi:hypothetical protein
MHHSIYTNHRSIYLLRPTPKKITVQSPIRTLRVEHCDDGWMIWLAANGDWTLGTFLLLGNDGSMKRVHWHPDGGVSEFEIGE